MRPGGMLTEQPPRLVAVELQKLDTLLPKNNLWRLEIRMLGNKAVPGMISR